MLRGWSSHVDDNAAARRDDVGPSAARDLADVNLHGVDTTATVELENLFNETRHLTDRADAILWIQPGVGRTPVHRHVVLCDTLASGLDVSIDPERRLHYEHTLNATGQRHDPALRVVAADLLIAVDEHDRHDAGLQPQVAEHAQRRQRLHQAALHVVHTRAAHDAGPLDTRNTRDTSVVPDLDRHLRQGAQVVDRVDMPEQQLARPASAPITRQRQQLTARRVAAQKARSVVDVGERGRQQIETGTLGFGLQRRRFDRREGAQPIDHSLTLAAHGVEYLLRLHAHDSPLTVRAPRLDRFRPAL